MNDKLKVKENRHSGLYRAVVSAWKQFTILLLGVFIGLLGGTEFWSHANPRAVKVTGTVRARQFELVDDKGVSRAVLGISELNGTYLRLNDQTGKLKGILDTTPEHKASVASVPSGIAQNFVARQSTSLRLYDEQGRTRVLLEADGGSLPREGEEQQGETRLTLLNPSGKMDAKLSSTAPGEAQLTFGHVTHQGTDTPNIYRYVLLNGSLKDGVMLDLSASGLSWFSNKRVVGEATIATEGKNGVTHLPNKEQRSTKP